MRFFYIWNYFQSNTTWNSIYPTIEWNSVVCEYEADFNWSLDSWNTIYPVMDSYTAW